jgi:hypothetical protein
MGPEDGSGLCDSRRMEREAIAERAVRALTDTGDFYVIRVRARGVPVMQGLGGRDPGVGAGWRGRRHPPALCTSFVCSVV